MQMKHAPMRMILILLLGSLSFLNSFSQNKKDSTHQLVEKFYSRSGILLFCILLQQVDLVFVQTVQYVLVELHFTGVAGKFITGAEPYHKTIELIAL